MNSTRCSTAGKGGWVLMVVAAAVLFFPPCRAAEEAPSLDNLWEDQAGGGGAPVPASTPTAAPMCTWQELLDSYLVKTGCWLGIGPFKTSGANAYELADAQANQLKAQVSDDKVTEVQLGIVMDKPGAQDFLDLQMASNFLLEALGAKAKKIADFNGELEKHKEALVGGASAAPVNLAAGRYLIALSRQEGDGAERRRYLITVTNRDAARDIIKQHSGAGSEGAQVEADKAGPIASAGPTPADKPYADPLKEEFINVIKNWQNVKKTVTRNRRTQELSEVLSGKALELQTNTINWLINNKKYWDITPGTVTVDRYSELVPGKRYAVVAQVRQSRKLVDDGTGQVLKEASDDDRVRYTVEKIADRWLITDYAIVTQSPPQAVKPPAGKVSR